MEVVRWHAVGRRHPVRAARSILSITLGLMFALATLAGCNTTKPNGDPSEPTGPDAADELTIDPGRLLTDTFEYEVDGQTQRGVLSRYEFLPRAPLLILLHDERGFDDWFMEQVEKYSSMKYVVVCPNLIGTTSATRDKVVYTNIEAAMTKAMQLVGYTESPRVGVMGWSLGGTHALTAARHLDLTAIVICYGELITREEALLGVREPILGIFGGQDIKVPMTRIVAFRESMQRIVGQLAANVWEDEGHDFMRHPHDSQNAREADLEILQWLDRYLMPD